MKSQELAIEINKLQIEMNGAGEIRTDDHEALTAYRAKLLTLVGLQKRQGEALESEAKRTAGAFNDAEEPQELRQLIHRAQGEIGAGFEAIINGRHPGGAFAELQAERSLPAHLMPLDLLREERAAVTGLTDNPGQEGQYRGYAYPGVVANFMGFSTPMVPYGTAVFPIVTTPATIGTPRKETHKLSPLS